MMYAVFLTPALLKAQIPWSEPIISTCYQEIQPGLGNSQVTLLRTGSNADITLGSTGGDITGYVVYSISEGNPPLLVGNFALGIITLSTSENYQLVPYLHGSAIGHSGVAIDLSFVDFEPTIKYPDELIPNTWPPQYHTYNQDCIQFDRDFPYSPNVDLCKQPEVKVEMIIPNPYQNNGLPTEFYTEWLNSPEDIYLPTFEASCYDALDCDPSIYGVGSQILVPKCQDFKFTFRIKPCLGKELICPDLEIEKIYQVCCDCKVQNCSSGGTGGTLGN